MPDPKILFAWAHLSDLRHGAAGKLALSALRDDLAASRERGCPELDAILVTGDVAESGLGAQYAEARAWLDDLARTTGVAPDAIHFVPGERDVCRTADADIDVERLVKLLRAGAEEIDVALARDVDRARLRIRISPYLAFAGREPCWVRTLDTGRGLRIRLVGLTTALLAMDDDKGKLRLGEGQLAEAIVGAANDELLLVLSHHPFQGGWLHDEKSAGAWIARHGHLHLYGHVEEPESKREVSGTGRPFVRIGAGHADTSYNIAAVVLRDDGSIAVRIWPRRWSDQQKGFVRDTDGIPDSGSYAEHAIAFRIAAAAPETARAQGTQGPRNISDSLRPLRPCGPLHHHPYEGPGGVPIAPVPHFLGRDHEMRDLRAMLAADSAVCIVATGLGGIGKTSLIRQYVATEAAAAFPDGSVWIDAMSLDADAARVCGRFGYEGERRPTVKEASEFLKKELDDRRVLVVIDNVFADRVDVAALPVVGGKSRTVITSRMVGLHESLGHEARQIVLGKWSKEACRAYLRDVAKDLATASDKSLDALSSFVGHLPLAVRLLARLLLRPGTTPDRLLLRLKQEPLGTLDKIATGADRGVAATFAASYEGLDDTHRPVLLALAACARVTSEGMVARVAGLREDDAAEVLADLAEQSLAECVDRDARLWTLHDVVRHFARAQDGMGHADAAHLALAEQHVEAHRDPLDWRAMEAGIDEVLAAVDRLLDGGDAQRAVKLVGRTQAHLGHRGRYGELIERYEALAAHLPEGSGTLAAVLGNAGLCYRVLGDLPKAIEHHRRDLAAYERLGMHDRQARQLGNLGACYQQQGDLHRAIEHLQRALALDEKLGLLEGQAISLGNLGLCYEGQGDLPRAIEHHQRALALNEKLGRLEGQAANLGNLGACYRVQGDLPRAIEHMQRALALNEKLGRLEGQAKQLHNLGACYLDQGNHPLALDHLDRALALKRRIGLPDHHPDVRRTLDVIAKLRPAP